MISLADCTYDLIIIFSNKITIIMLKFLVIFLREMILELYFEN